MSREFWLREFPRRYGFGLEAFYHKNVKLEKSLEEGFPDDKLVHVIEYSAFENLKNEINIRDNHILDCYNKIEILSKELEVIKNDKFNSSTIGQYFLNKIKNLEECRCKQLEVKND